MKDKICLFAGTSEGRIVAETIGRRLGEGTKDFLCVCVATEYGEVLLDGIPNLIVHRGRMDEKAMEEYFRKERYSLIVDATHPYAELVSENIRAAAGAAGIRVMRVLRERNEYSAAGMKTGAESGAGCETGVAPGMGTGDRAGRRIVEVSCAGEAAEYLNGMDGAILLTTGAKELREFAGLDKERLYARVLPLESSLAACSEAGILTSHIYAMQGPFTEEMNLAHLHSARASFLVTKESGKNGGFQEKLTAAEKAGASVIIIKRPAIEEGFTLEDTIKLLTEMLTESRTHNRTGESAETEDNPAPSRHVTIIGIGAGNPDLFTAEADAALRSCSCIIGAGRMTEALASYQKPFYHAIDPLKIREYIDNNPQYTSAAAVMSGDVGFYSGAKKLKEALTGYQVSFVCGISSVVYFASRLQIPWEDIRLISLHGRDAGLAAAVRMNRRVMALTGGENRVSAVCRKLCGCGLGSVKIWIGERLSYAEETITEGRAEEFTAQEFDSLSVILIENDRARNGIRHGIPDGEFVRSDVPMTKSEVRSITLSKLSLTSSSVVYDIGAGTGSVSVEAALAAFEGSVYAVEKNPEGVKVIRQNAEKFALDNLYPVEGSAPEALTPLPVPTHAFIGGSSGNMKEIIACLLKRNPDIRIVVNTVTLESLTEAMECVKEFGFRNYEAVCVNISRGRKLGKYHLMTAQNPVYVILMV